ncbi:unnamed protein product [Rhodiola kirilowii]
MALLYSMVARETTVLAEYTAVAGNTDAIARKALKTLTSYLAGLDCRLHFLMDEYLIHVLRIDAIVFLCMTDGTFPRMVAFAYLEDVHKRFIEKYGKVAHDAPPYLMTDEFSSVLHQQLEFYLSNPSTDTLNRVAKDSEIHTILEENIGKLEQIELLEDTITTVKNGTLHFSEAKSLETDMEKKCVLSAKDGTLDNDTPDLCVITIYGQLNVNPNPSKDVQRLKHATTSTETGDNVPCDSPSDDDWEAIADLPLEKLLAPQVPPKVVDLDHTQNHEVKTPKRRGRGTFSYKKEELYSDQVSCGSCPAEPPEVNGVGSDDCKRNRSPTFSRCDTGHVLVLSGFSPTTKTTDLEKLFEDFKGRGFVIRWVDDTIALVVFQTPLTALEALNSKKFPFNVRVLNEDDSLASLVPARDLEPPRQRPLTSAVTARRLIAHGMGIKLPSNMDSAEFRKQEEARKQRIIARQSLKEDAWGDDD